MIQFSFFIIIIIHNSNLFLISLEFVFNLYACQEERRKKKIKKYIFYIFWIFRNQYVDLLDHLQ
jgi:hypothetical protein